MVLASLFTSWRITRRLDSPENRGRPEGWRVDMNDSAQKTAVIDGGVFHEWSSTLTLTPYMEPAWAELVTRKGDRGGPLRLGTNWLYRNPMHGNKAASAYPAKGIPGSDREMLAKRPGDRLVLGYDEGLLATGFSYHYLARAAVRAANDWTIDYWLGHDPRFYG